jgi:hypothetical protein
VGVDEEGLYIDINLLHMQILTPLWCEETKEYFQYFNSCA